MESLFVDTAFIVTDLWLIMAELPDVRISYRIAPMDSPKFEAKRRFIFKRHPHKMISSPNQHKIMLMTIRWNWSTGSL